MLPGAVPPDSFKAIDASAAALAVDRRKIGAGISVSVQSECDSIEFSNKRIFL
jgi:hypothetical protein